MTNKSHAPNIKNSSYSTSQKIDVLIELKIELSVFFRDTIMSAKYIKMHEK